MRGHLDVKELETYKKEELQKLARELGVSDEGTKKDIAERIAAVELDIPDDAQQTAPDDAQQTTSDDAQQTAPENKQPELPQTNGEEVRVKVIQTYNDLELKKIVEKNEEKVLVMKKDRAAYLAERKLVKIVE